MKIKLLLQKQKTQFFFTCLLILAFLIISETYFYYQNTIQIINEAGTVKGITQKKNEDFCRFIRKLDGVCTEKGKENLWPVAIMIDNHPDTWPQYGLSQAQLVYNTLVEGGTTRLIAFFSSDKEIEKIGPVRSARPYYLTWAKELNALYGHSGGSPEALEKIKEYQIIDLEESSAYGPNYFWRDYNKFSPHNLFTSSQKIAQARIDWELFDKIPDYQTWQFNNQLANSNNELITESIYIDYSPGVLFDIEYKYSSSTQAYLRFQNNQAHIDGLTNEQISVKNLIIQFVPEEVHLDELDRLKIETIGQGDAWIFYNGKIIKGKWVKNDLKQRTVFYNYDNNEEIIFTSGNIWLEVVPANRKVTYQY